MARYTILLVANNSRENAFRKIINPNRSESRTLFYNEKCGKRNPADEAYEVRETTEGTNVKTNNVDNCTILYERFITKTTSLRIQLLPTSVRT